VRLDWGGISVNSGFHGILRRDHGGDASRGRSGQEALEVDDTSQTARESEESAARNSSFCRVRLPLITRLPKLNRD
jgi:hypothetical protein